MKAFLLLLLCSIGFSANSPFIFNPVGPQSLIPLTNGLLQSSGNVVTGLSAASATAFLIPFTGDTGIGGAQGLVPAPAALDGTTKFKLLAADGNWTSNFPNNTSTEAVRAVSIWDEQTHPSANQWFDITYAPDLRRTVALGSSGASRIMYSDDGGITWTNATAAAANTWTSITYSPELKRFVAVAFDGTTSDNVMYSTDGITWTSAGISQANNWYAVKWAPSLGLFCATSLNGTNRVATSPDGITWTVQTSPSAQWYALAWSDTLNLFAAVALGGSIMTSPDGVTWTSRTGIGSADWHEIVWAKGLGLFVAVAITGTNRVMTSPDGINWTARSAAAASAWRTVEWSPELGILVALSSSGTAMSSPNGINWTSRTLPSANQFYGLVWNKDFRVFIGSAISGTNRIIRSTYVGGFQSSGLQGPTGATGATGPTGPTGPASATGELISDTATQTTQQTTTSTSFVDIPGLTLNLTSSIDSKISATFSGAVQSLITPTSGEFRIVIDAQNGTGKTITLGSITAAQNINSNFLSTQLAAGTYTVKVQYREAGGGVGTVALNTGILVAQVQQGAGPYSMSQAMEFREDWISPAIAGDFAWTSTVSGTGAASTIVTTNMTSNNPGIVQHTTGTTATGRAAHSLNLSSLFFGGGIVTFESLIYIPTLADATQDYRIRIGFGDLVDGNDQVDGVYFEYDRGVSANWRAKTSNNSSRTATDTGIAVAAGAWVKLSWVMNAAGNSCAFYVNGVLGATNTTNIPTTVARVSGPFLIISKIAGTTARTLLVDYFFSRQVFTTPR